MAYVLRISFVAALGGLLFGYDTAVISGAIGFLKERFGLNEYMVGWAASSALVGCIAGALLAGALSDRFGRKNALRLAALLFLVSAIGTALPRDLATFVVFRIVGGVGVGAASLLSPLYIAEVSPPRIRGRLVSLNQLAIVSGMLLVYFVNLMVQRLGDQAWNVDHGWRWMFGSEALPASLFLLLLYAVPESPRWLAKQGRSREALSVLALVSPGPQAGAELARIEQALAQESASFGQLFHGGMRMALVIGVVLAVFQQVTGINAILYYAPTIFQAAGAAGDAAFVQTVSVGAVNLVFTFVAIWLVDKAGRKALLLAGTALQCTALFLVGAFYYAGSQSVWVLVCILIYVAAFAMAMGPVVWVILSEIFPTRIRGLAMSVATLVLWTSCFAVSQTFPILVEHLGSAWTFWLYAALSAASFVFTLRVVPETKGRSLEEIEQSFLAPFNEESQPTG